MNNENRFEKVSFDQFLKDVKKFVSAGELSFENEDGIRRYYDQIQLPRRATAGSAGYDFYMPFSEVFTPDAPVQFPTGIRVHITPGQFLMCVPRSGLGFKYGVRLINTTGVIDEDFWNAENEGHIMAKFVCETPFTLKQGDRYMQGIFLPYFITVDDDPVAKERTGGFGSTGS